MSTGKNIRLKVKDIPELEPRHARLIIEYLKDFNVRRAAVAVRMSYPKADEFLETDSAKKAIQRIYEEYLDDVMPDAEWLLYELLDNHKLAREQGNVSASNTALRIIAQHNMVNALAVQKVEVDVNTNEEVAARLRRGRDRVAASKSTDDNTPSFL